MDNCNCNPGGKTILTKDITKEIQKVIDENGKLRDQVRELVDIIKRYGLGNDLNFKCCCHGNGNINASDLVLIKEVRIEDGNLVITFNTQEGDQVITYSIFDLFNPANYYTKLEVENKILEMLENAGAGTNVSDIYEINYVVPSVNDLPNNADPMEIALVNNELEGTLALYRKSQSAGWEESAPDGNYIYDNKVYKYNDGTVSINVNEIVKRSSFNCVVRCHNMPFKGLTKSGVKGDSDIYINNMISGHPSLVTYDSSTGLYKDYIGDLNTIYYLVESNEFFVVNGNVPSSELKLVHDDIYIPIYEIIDVLDEFPSEPSSMPEGYYISPNQDGSITSAIVHISSSFIYVYDFIKTAYIIYEDELREFHINEGLSHTDIPYIKGGTIIVSRWGGALIDGTAVGQYGYNAQQKQMYKWNGSNWYEIELRTNVIYINLQNNKQYRWNGSDMVELAGGAGSQDIYFTNGNYSSYNAEDPSKTTNGKFNTNDNGQEAKEVDLSPLFEGVETRIDEINREDYRKNNDDVNERLYPEYWYEDGEAARIEAAKIKQWRNEYKTENPSATEAQIDTAWDASGNASTRASIKAAAKTEAHTYCEANPITYCPDYYSWNKVWYKEDVEQGVASNYLEAEVIYPEEYMNTTIMDIETMKTTKVIEVYPISGATELNYNWLSLTGTNGAALEPKRGIIYKLKTASTNYPAGTRFKYRNYTTEEYNALTSAQQTYVTTEGLRQYIKCVNNDDEVIQFMTEDVVYSTILNYFLLKVVDGGTTTYYKRWKNSYLWNKEVDNNGTVTVQGPREDTIYCPISKGDILAYIGSTQNYPLYDNKTWIYKNDNPTSIYSTFTNFRNAINICANKNNGNLRLHSTKIYGIAQNTKGYAQIGRYKNFTIDGQGGTLCFVDRYMQTEATRQQNSYTTPYTDILYIYRCSDFTIKNIKIKCVKNSICNTASHRPSSFSIAPVFGINIISCQNIEIDNVEFSGCRTDIQCKREYTSGNNIDPVIQNLTIRNWISNDSGGCYITGTDNVIIDNSFVHTGYFNGVHLFYFGELNYNVICRNSTFIQSSVFNSNIGQWKRPSGSTSTKDYLDNSVYAVGRFTIDHCFILYGARGIFGGDKYNKRTIIVRNSIIKQTTDRWIDGKLRFWSADNSGSQADARAALFSATSNSTSIAFIEATVPTDVEIEKCYINIFGKLIYINNVEFGENIDDKILRITVIDNHVRQADPTHYSEYDGGAHVIGINNSGNLRVQKVENNISNIDLFIKDNFSSRANGEAFNIQRAGFTYYNTTLCSNMVLITTGVTVNDISIKVWRNTITGKTYKDDNTEFPSAAYASELDNVTTGFVYYNTTVNAFVECTEISGGTPTWARKATAEIINPGSDPIPENGGQQQAELNP